MNAPRYLIIRRGWALVTLCLILVLGWPTAIYAQTPFILAGTAPAPLGGAEQVAFVSQAVDAGLRRADDGLYYVDNRSAIRLSNLDRFNPATVSLGFPGWAGGEQRFSTSELSNFAIRTSDGAGIGWTPQTRDTTWGGTTQASEWADASVTVPADSRQRFLVDWTQGLGGGPLLTYSFGAIPASAWRDNVGSLRVTLILPQVFSEEMLIETVTGSYEYAFRGNQIEWLIVDQEPTVNPSVTFIAPHVWQEVEATRAARATDPLAANLRLAELYSQLATAGVAAYDAEAEAALEAARRAAPDNPAPLTRLAALYRARAEQAGGDLALLEQSVNLTEAAVAAGANDPALIATLESDLMALATAWTAPNPTVALEFLARAETLTGNPAIATQRQALAEQLALAALEAGDTVEAIRLAETYGLPTGVAAAPYLSSAALQVVNTPTERTLILSVTGAIDGAEALTARMSDLAVRLTTSGYPATWDAALGELRLTIVGPPTTWQAAGATINTMIGEDIELFLLKDVLTSPGATFTTSESWIEREYTYREEVRVGARAAERAVQYQQQIETLPTAWERALILRTVADWQAFADRQSLRVTTQFDTDGATLQRDWTLPLPVAQRLEWEETTLRRDRLLYIVGGVAGGLFLILALIWLPGKR